MHYYYYYYGETEEEEVEQDGEEDRDREVETMKETGVASSGGAAGGRRSSGAARAGADVTAAEVRNEVPETVPETRVPVRAGSGEVRLMKGAGPDSESPSCGVPPVEGGVVTSDSDMEVVSNQEAGKRRLEGERLQVGRGSKRGKKKT